MEGTVSFASIETIRPIGFQAGVGGIDSSAYIPGGHSAATRLTKKRPTCQQHARQHPDAHAIQSRKHN